eukprot:TRINITY_DN6296_c0_g3_i1.p1 TRINITY_DN6296_c0_g3~~TRINITY_DN6296_c0_g3_i1.p1  ORF type:complete len:717 (+),score=127.47 TRINITY_DN6296_c0_g3_i1:117-2267(+)
MPGSPVLSGSAGEVAGASCMRKADSAMGHPTSSSSMAADEVVSPRSAPVSPTDPQTKLGSAKQSAFHLPLGKRAKVASAIKNFLGPRSPTDPLKTSPSRFGLPSKVIPRRPKKDATAGSASPEVASPSQMSPEPNSPKSLTSPSGSSTANMNSTVLSISNIERDGSPMSPKFVNLGTGADGEQVAPERRSRRGTITRRRESRGFDSSVRLYSPAESDDPIIPPSGIFSTTDPGATQRRRSTVLFSPLASSSRSPQNASISPCVHQTGRWSRNSSMIGSLRASEVTDDESEQPAQEEPPAIREEILPKQDTITTADNGIMHLGDDFLGGDVLECENHSDDTMSEFSHDDAINVKEKGSLMAQGDEEVDVDEIIADCARDKLLSLDLFELSLPEAPSKVFLECQHVTALDLSGNDLKLIPPEIGILHHLQKLTLKSNSLRSLPPELSQCEHLKQLYLDQNQLATLPVEMSLLQDLVIVGLDWNEIVGFPECLCNIPGLEMLYMVENPNVSLPASEKFDRFEHLTISLDNSPRLKEQAKTVLQSHIGKVEVQWNQIFPDLIIKNMYLGSLRSAQEVRIYEELGIKHLASIGRELSVVLGDGMEHIQCNVDDLPDSDLSSIFTEVHKFMDNALRREEGCLVHCFKGQSRSATIVISYLMKTQMITRDAAVAIVKDKRPMINPNAGFMNLLLRYESTLGVVSSTATSPASPAAPSPEGDAY